MYLPHAQYPQFPNMQPAQTYMPYQLPPKKIDGSKDDPHMMTINAVIQQVTQELKQILKRDFNKKMVENTAFQKFESWWEEESTKEYKTNLENSDKVQEKPKDNLNILLEANRENLYSNISLDNLGLGLGLRASLPKMPSFRRKKIPSPVPEDEDSRKLSDNEEIVHDSDNEVTRPIQRVRKVSSSSSSSSESSDESSESDSSSSDESSAESEVENLELMDGIEASNKTPEPMQVDTDSQEEVPLIVEKPPPTPPLEKIAIEPKILDSDDGDLSEGEREYLERRRKNTEWMEQIEKERAVELRRKEKVVMEREKEREGVETFVKKAVVKKTLSSDEETMDEKLSKIEQKTALNGLLAKRSSVSSSRESSPSTQHVAMEHSYCMPPEQENNIPTPSPETTKQLLTHDHIYTSKEEEKPSPQPIKEKPPKQRKQKHNYKKLQELQNTMDFENRFIQKPKSIDVKHRERDMVAEMGILYEFLTKGIDQEDINYMRQSYEAMLADDSIGYWLNDTHWVDHCITDLYSSPPKKRKRDDPTRIHQSGCARTEGYYKIEAYEKKKYKHHHGKVNAPEVPVTKMQGLCFGFWCVYFRFNSNLFVHCLYVIYEH